MFPARLARHAHRSRPGIAELILDKRNTGILPVAGHGQDGRATVREFPTVGFLLSYEPTVECLGK